MKNLSRKQLKNKLDRVFSLFIRIRDCNDKGIVVCPLCGKKIKWNDLVCQCMHFVKRFILKYRYAEENCYAGCSGCNVFLNGNYQVYTLFMIKKFWLEKVENMLNDKQIYKVHDYELEEMIVIYTQKTIELAKKKGIDITKYFTKKVLTSYWYYGNSKQETQWIKSV